jgi:hypothetical protein
LSKDFNNHLLIMSAKGTLPAKRPAREQRIIDDDEDEVPTKPAQKYQKTSEEAKKPVVVE